jgi:hypothetical protein
VALQAGTVLPTATLAWYQQAAARGEQVLHIDPGASLIVATVRRGGPLARLGHDHVVASHAVEGLAAVGMQRADFGFRLDSLAVDEGPLRAEAKLDTQPSPEAIAGTRVNMLGRVLDAQRYPVVLLQVLGQSGGGPSTVRPVSLPVSLPMTLQVSLHGVTRGMPVTVRIERAGATLSASGTLPLRQSDFGITPMSVLGGAMTVADTIELRYRIVARPL